MTNNRTSCKHCDGRGSFNQRDASERHGEHLLHGYSIETREAMDFDIECPVCDGTGLAGGAR